MRRARRTRMSTKRNQIVNQLVEIAKQPKNVIDLYKGNKNIVFGRVLNCWLDSSQESVIDRYIDEEAIDATNYAINIVAKEIRN